MGRKYKPIDPRAPFASLANGLRALMIASGKTCKQIGEEQKYATSAISEAAAGRKLPTWGVTRAIVLTCGGNETEWAARWRTEDQRRARRGERR